MATILVAPGYALQDETRVPFAQTQRQRATIYYYGATNTEPVQHLSWMQLSWEGTMQQNWLNFTHIH